MTQNPDRQHPIIFALSQLHQRFIDQIGEFPAVEFDPCWRSRCESGKLDQDDQLIWQPVQQTTTLDFSGLARAAEESIHADIKAYFGGFWSATLSTSAEEGEVNLIQLWNEEDFHRLIENLIGHLLLKRRQRRPFSVFFANTEINSDLFLTINNQDGSIWLEAPGKKPLRQVEANLAAFLTRLQPLNQSPNLY